jgi:hypothetical protein
MSTMVGITLRVMKDLHLSTYGMLAKGVTVLFCPRYRAPA